MTYDETTLWRRFMQSKAALNNFEYLYRSHRFDKRDLEQYLEETDAEDVLLSAFGFSGAGNTIFGYRYWKNLDEKWQAKLREYRETGHMGAEPTQVKCSHCKRLLPASQFATNSNGMLHKHCMECESGEWDRKRREQKQEEKELRQQEEESRKLEWEVSVKESLLQKTTKVCSHCGRRKLMAYFAASDMTEDGLQSWCKACQSGMESASNHVDNQDKKEEQKPTAAEKTSAPKLGEYDATLHYKACQKSITFNSILSEVLQKGGFTKCYLNSDRQHRQFLIFNNAEGANIVIVSRHSSMLLGINSAEICRSLATRFNLSLGETFYLHITRNMSRRVDIATIEILAVRSRDEYVGIVQRRESGKQDEPERIIVPAKVESPVVPASEPLIDFGDSTPQSAEELLRMLIEQEKLAEQDLAAFLYKRGWKLQEPVRSYKKFTL